MVNFLLLICSKLFICNILVLEWKVPSIVLFQASWKKDLQREVDALVGKIMSGLGDQRLNIYKTSKMWSKISYFSDIDNLSIIFPKVILTNEVPKIYGIEGNRRRAE